MLCYDLLDISRVCDATSIATFKKDPSMLEIWFFAIFKMRQDYTNSTHGWEGPFIVFKVTRPGSYRLIYPDGQEVPISWNIEHLQKFYPWFDDQISCVLFTINKRYTFWFINYYIIQWSAVQAASSHSVFASSEEGLQLNLSLQHRVKGMSILGHHAW